jgi:hypothetical protein
MSTPDDRARLLERIARDLDAANGELGFRKHMRSRWAWVIILNAVLLVALLLSMFYREGIQWILVLVSVLLAQSIDEYCRQAEKAAMAETSIMRLTTLQSLMVSSVAFCADTEDHRPEFLPRIAEYVDKLLRFR